MNRSIISVTSVSALIAATAIVSAVPAHAASTNLSVNCNAGASYSVGLSPSSITGALANDTIVITGMGGINDVNVTLSGVTGPSTISSGSLPATFTITSSSPSYITFTVVASAGNNCNGLIKTLSINGGDPSSSSSSAQSSTPAPIIQQFGKPRTGTCDAAAPQSLNWSGVASGGWSETWGEWMNDGKGGAVCTRTLVYSTAQSRWIVG